MLGVAGGGESSVVVQLSGLPAIRPDELERLGVEKIEQMLPS